MADSSLNTYPRMTDLAYAYGGPGNASGLLKAAPEDFVVEEVLGFELSGDGEHLWLYLECKDMSTDFTVKQLARAFHIEKRAISYSGKKDRRAVTRQWFSLHMPGQPVDLPEQIHPNVKVLSYQKHSKKLRRGSHRENLFHIRLSQCKLPNLPLLEQRLQTIKQSGFPNYFGPQRFGRQENNIDFACQVVQSGKRLKRQERDRVFSTLRAWDFNHFLSQRIAEGTWNQYLAGDLLQLQGSSSFFQPDSWDSSLQERLEAGDIMIAGLLPGKGEKQVSTRQGPYQPARDLIDYLQRQKVEQGVRPLKVFAKNLNWHVQNNQLQLSFSLPKGAYATSLLREVLSLQESAS